MQYVNLGKTGMKVSRLCLGMMSYGSKQWREWVLEEHEAKPFIQRALEAGINFFDTADVYSLGESERVTGKILRDLGVKRENVIVATKVNGQMSDDINDRGLSRKHIPSTSPCSDYKWIMWTCTKSTAGIMKFLLRRLSKH